MDRYENRYRACGNSCHDSYRHEYTPPSRKSWGEWAESGNPNIQEKLVRLFTKHSSEAAKLRFTFSKLFNNLIALQQFWIIQEVSNLSRT